MSLQTVLSCHLWTESLFRWVPKIISWQAKSSATRNSLVALDELGRGASISEGQAIAESVLQHFVHKVQCQGMFFTHYHRLSVDYQNDPKVFAVSYGMPSWEWSWRCGRSYISLQVDTWCMP